MFKIFKKTMTISELINYYQQNKLNLSPYYQRTGEIWNKVKKQKLIDSIFNQIDLPKFYFHFYPDDENGKYDYSIIDGKQRILAIMEFVENRLALRKDFKFLDNDCLVNIQGLTYKEIQDRAPDVLARFLLFELDIVFVDTDDIDRINEMFIRINAGVAVNNAEKRNAYGGVLIQKIRECCEKHCFFMNTVSFENGRNEYQEIFLKLFVLEYKNEIITLNDGNIKEVVLECKECKRNEEGIIQIVSNNLQKMSAIFGEKSKILKKNNIVTYYWFLKDKYNRSHNLYEFILRFEEERKKKQLNDNPKLIKYLRYNELVKQGTYQKKSYEERIVILEELYTIYQKKFIL